MSSFLHSGAILTSLSSNSTALQVDVIHATHPQLVAFYFLNIWPSHLGLPILLAATLLSKKVQRHPTFVNLFIVWIVVGFSSSLLLYAGRATGPEPSQTLCLLQASLLYGMPPMASISAFTLVLQMFLVIRESSKGHDVARNDNPVRVWAMVAAPWIAFFFTIMATALTGVADPANISRDRRFFYCSVKAPGLTKPLALIASLVLFATFVLEVWTVFIMYRRWVAFRSKNVEVHGEKSTKKTRRLRLSVELELPLRIVGFGFYILIAMSISAMSLSAPASPIPDLFIATAASVVILIFGTQRDILRALCFWRPSQENEESTEDPVEVDDEKCAYP